MPRWIAGEDLDALATGAWVLGTGGGGDPYVSLVAARALYRQGKRVRLIDAADLAADDLVAMVSFQGAPLVNSERLPDPALMEKAIRVMEAHVGRRFAAVMSAEIGGSNGVQPLLAAASMDLPLVDADAMGRAFPDVSKTSFAVRGLRPWPLSVVDVRRNVAIIPHGADWFWMERMSRQIVTEMGSTASTCKAPRTGAEVQEHGIAGSVTRAIGIGRLLARVRREGADPVAALLAAEGGLELFTGKVLDVRRRTAAGFLRGETVLAGLGRYRGEQFELAFQNEFSVAWRDGEVVATVPDLLCVLDRETGDAIGTETLRYGQRVAVIAMPSPPVFCSPRGLEHAGPRAFGFDLPFTSPFAAPG